MVFIFIHMYYLAGGKQEQEVIQFICNLQCCEKTTKICYSGQNIIGKDLPTDCWSTSSQTEKNDRPAS